MTAPAFAYPNDDFYISHAGIADNPGIPEESLLAMRREFANNPSQLAAREKGLFVKPEGLILKVFDEDKHSESLTVEQTIALIRRSKIFAGLDPGAWRFAFTLWGIDPLFHIWLLEEYFSQNEILDVRAARIMEINALYGITRRYPIYADCANPTDIMEINQAFKRAGAKNVNATAVGNNKKLIKPGISRLENIIVRGQFTVRKEIGQYRTWRLGYSADKAGEPVIGSRWLWEIANWRWPSKDDATKAQLENPDDNTADGADMMACSRYAVMSALRPGKEPVDEEADERSAFAPATLAEDAERSRKIKHRLQTRRRATIETEIADSMREC